MCIISLDFGWIVAPLASGILTSASATDGVNKVGSHKGDMPNQY